MDVFTNSWRGCEYIYYQNNNKNTISKCKAKIAKQLLCTKYANWKELLSTVDPPEAPSLACNKKSQGVPTYI